MNKPIDHDLDLSVAGMLRFGVSLAAIVVFIGVSFYYDTVNAPSQFLPFPSWQHGTHDSKRNLLWCYAGRVAEHHISGIVYT